MATMNILVKITLFEMFVMIMVSFMVLKRPYSCGSLTVLVVGGVISVLQSELVTDQYFFKTV